MSKDLKDLTRLLNQTSITDVDIDINTNTNKKDQLILKDATLKSISDYILQNNIQNIIVMSGAGISTSAGIPDFRSPGTGLYDNLQKYNLPYPEAIFDLNYFVKKPDPFFELAREMIGQSRYRPTLTHYFIKLLHDKGRLLRNYTQNIDTLERATGLHPDKIVEAHGSFHTASCIGPIKDPLEKGNTVDLEDSDSDSEVILARQRILLGCGKRYDKAWLESSLKESKIPLCEKCDGIIKPDITFFGESLPKRFFELSQVDFKKCDLLIVLGTSLKVHPFAGLVHAVDKNVPRLVINKDKLYGFEYEQEYEDLKDLNAPNSNPIIRDAFYLGDCDEGCNALVKLLGWDQDLEKLCNKNR